MRFVIAARGGHGTVDHEKLLPWRRYREWMGVGVSRWVQSGGLGNGYLTQGGRPVRIPDPPPPPPDPPKVFEPVFFHLRFWGKGLAPKAPKLFFLPFLRGYFFFTLCVHTQNTQSFVENSKMFEKHRKLFDPRLDLWV